MCQPTGLRLEMLYSADAFIFLLLELVTGGESPPDGTASANSQDRLWSSQCYHHCTEQNLISCNILAPEASPPVKRRHLLSPLQPFHGICLKWAINRTKHFVPALFVSSDRSSLSVCAPAVTSKWQLRPYSPVNSNSSAGENSFRRKTGRGRAVY